jgi:hypothetical protein
MNKLTELALAYKLACEFDYCPDIEEREKAEKVLRREVPDNVFYSYSGNSPDEIARMLVNEVLRQDEVGR